MPFPCHHAICKLPHKKSSRLLQWLRNHFPLVKLTQFEATISRAAAMLSTISPPDQDSVQSHNQSHVQLQWYLAFCFVRKNSQCNICYFTSRVKKNHRRETFHKFRFPPVVMKTNTAPQTFTRDTEHSRWSKSKSPGLIANRYPKMWTCGKNMRFCTICQVFAMLFARHVTKFALPIKNHKFTAVSRQ